jgi:hypothetical protein
MIKFNKHYVEIGVNVNTLKAAFSAPYQANFGSGYTVYVTCKQCGRTPMLSGMMAHYKACKAA